MRDVKGYEGLYGITSCGRVWSYKRQKFLKPISHRGYLIINLCKNGKIEQFFIHRLVAEAYIPNTDNLPMINHKDENKANNCLQNLELCDAKYNNNYGTRMKRISEKIKKPILQFDLEGNFIKEWLSATDVGREIQSNICMCLKGKKQTAYGYKWVYKK